MKVFDETMRTIGNKDHLNLLFVCSGNICRSAFADFIFRRMVKESVIIPKDKIMIHSGALSIKNEIIDPRTKKILTEYGFEESEINKHKPKHILEHEDLFENADLIIGMTNEHKFDLPEKFRSKFQQLSKFAIDTKIDIADPYWTKNLEEFRDLLKHVKYFLEIIKDNFEKFFSLKV